MTLVCASDTYEVHASVEKLCSILQSCPIAIFTVKKQDKTSLHTSEHFQFLRIAKANRTIILARIPQSYRRSLTAPWHTVKHFLEINYYARIPCENSGQRSTSTWSTSQLFTYLVWIWTCWGLCSFTIWQQICISNEWASTLSGKPCISTTY